MAAPADLLRMMRSVESMLTARLAREIADGASEEHRRKTFTLGRLLDAGLPAACGGASLLGETPRAVQFSVADSASKGAS